MFFLSDVYQYKIIALNSHTCQSGEFDKVYAIFGIPIFTLFSPVTRSPSVQRESEVTNPILFSSYLTYNASTGVQTARVCVCGISDLISVSV